MTYSAGLRRSRLSQSDCAARSRTWSRRRCRQSRRWRSPWRICRLALRIPGDSARVRDCDAHEKQGKGGGGVSLLERAAGGLITHGTAGQLSKSSTLDEGSGYSEGCGQEGESSDGVLHFRIFFFFSILFYSLFWPLGRRCVCTIFDD